MIPTRTRNKVTAPLILAYFRMRAHIDGHIDPDWNPHTLNPRQTRRVALYLITVAILTVLYYTT